MNADTRPPSSASTSAAADGLYALQAELLRRFARGARRATAFWLLLACALLALGAGHVPRAVLIAVAAAYAACLLARERLAARMLQAPDKLPAPALRRWRTAFSASVVANGLLLGGICAGLVWAMPLPGKWAVTLLAAVAALSAAVNPLRRTSSRLFLALLLLPLVFAWLLSQGLAGWQPAVAVLALHAVHEVLARRQDRLARERLRLAAGLAQANARFESDSRSRIRLVAEASHDLRQPVQTLVMMLDRLDPRAGREEITRRYMAIRECAHKVTDMLADVLDLSRFDLGEIAADVQDVSLSALLEDIDGTYGPQARMKGLEWRVSAVPRWVRTDPNLITRVVGNLVSNAIKYTEHGAVAVTCRIEAELVHLCVIDTGVGIPKSGQSRIFEQNVRLNADQQPGHGIGLGIVSRACRLLGHPLALESAPNAGSRFTVTLPLCMAQHSPPDAFLNSGQFLPWNDKLVVFLEDDKRLRGSTAEVLESLGLTVVAAASVEEAMAQPVLHERRPDLFISDMHLGDEEDGLQAVRELRSEYPSVSVPAILLTGDLAPELRARARAESVRVAYKPIRPSRLKEMVSRCLEGTYPPSEPMPLS